MQAVVTADQQCVRLVRVHVLVEGRRDRLGLAEMG
jgi:hypothetical protein